jgi:succinyl-diaminopimelate desuccinylase
MNKRGVMEDLMHKNIDDDFGDTAERSAVNSDVRSVYDGSGVSVEHPFGPEMRKLLKTSSSCEKAWASAQPTLQITPGRPRSQRREDVGILAHLDVVPEGDVSAWTVPPDSGAVVDGKLYGRGSLDDKGPAYSALYAMKALRDSGFRLDCRIRLIVGLDEESGGRCIARYLETEEVPDSSFSPDANFPLINAEKGIFHCWVEKGFSEEGNGSAPHLIDIKGGDRYNVVPDMQRRSLTAVLEQIS